MNKSVRYAIVLYLFLSINREFGLFGFDLRLLLMPLVFYGCLVSLKNKHFSKRSVSISLRNSLNSPSGWLLLYLIAAVFSSVAWIWNGLPLKGESLLNLLLVFLLNALMVLLIILNDMKIDADLVLTTLVASVAFLGLSQLLTYFNVPLNWLLSDSEVRVLQGGGEHYNLFGQHFRVSGFAEDPNYACLFNVIGLSLLRIEKRLPRTYKIAICFLLISGIALSWSRTIVLGAFAVLGILLFSARLRFSASTLFLGLVGFVLMGCLFAPTIASVVSVDFLQTILTRLDLWERAEILFLSSPLIGNGLTAFRSFNMVEVPQWYVHCHSTFWSILSESGIIAFIPFCAALFHAAKRGDSARFLFVFGVFLFFCINFDATYLQISVVVLSVLPTSLDSWAYSDPSIIGKGVSDS